MSSPELAFQKKLDFLTDIVPQNSDQVNSMAKSMLDELHFDLRIKTSALTSSLRTKDFVHHLSLLNDPLKNQIKLGKDFVI